MANSPVQKWKYDTFLNFRREDTGSSHSFVSRLCQRLQHTGINVFQGEINNNNMEAIEESRTAIVIFSEKYFSDTRCLEELNKIMECGDIKGQLAIPVFYHVERFYEFMRLSRQNKVFANRIFNLPGFRLGYEVLVSGSSRKEREEEKCIQEIVDKIWLVPSIAKCPVGVKSRVEELKLLLKTELGGVYFVGVWGVSGVGKTTIARAIFDEISCEFEGSYFLANIRETSEKHGLEGLKHLQQKLLSQILKQDSVDLTSVHEGVYMLSQILHLKKVIIVLDDVNNTHQLEYLVGNHDWFGEGSRVVATTRNTNLLYKYDMSYCVPRLASHEALELFCWHAFQQGDPVKEFEELSNYIVDYAEGLPLALEVVGSFLYRRGMEEVSSELHRLKDLGNGKIVKLLSLILDELGSDYKNIFLHIACFFRGKRKDDVITALNRLGFKSEIGIDVLTKRSLLYMSEGMIEMHDSIAQMGQQVARDSELDRSWNCNSNLWHEKNIKTVVSASEITGTPTVPMASHTEFLRKWKCDVFLNFRGEDTRNNFVAHLYKRLEDRGINTFNDNAQLERGKFISPELMEAIEESRTAIIIFSENYASSKWCLEELTKIMECTNKKRQVAIPVFYNVEPSDVRMLRNSFGKALAKHEEDLKDTGFERVQRWKDSLRTAADISGWDVRKTANGNEAECIDQIINENFQNIQCMVSATEKCLVGMESRICEVELSLKVGSGGVRFVGIWGMGGVGKTTVARKVFDKLSHTFQRCCFLEKVRDESKMHGLKHLQKILLSSILHEKSVEITSVCEGASMIKKKLCLRKVLIVFDDVDAENQLEYLVGMPDWFGDGSRIIITARDSDLLRKNDQLYLVPELSKHESLELFSLHAFQKPTPDKEFLKLSKCVVDYAKGLPLALKVLGSFLYKRGINEWRSTLDRLKDTGNKDIVEQLSLSLDGLTLKDKNIFLDIACFFRGEREDNVKEILKSFGLNPEIGIDILAKRSLLYISEGMVEMHDLIEQMGQEVARDVEQDKPWNHTRLWHEKDIKTVFSSNQRADSVRGIVVPTGSDRHIYKWSKAFRNMPCLRLLMVKGEEVRHHDPVSDPMKYLPSSLIWLDWRYYTSKFLPANFEPENLVALKMTFSSLVEIFKEPKEFGKLTILNLSFSERLLRTPNFSDTPHLERVILKGCVSLIEVHASIGNLKKLIFLDMENCKNLESFSSSSIQMESLESVNLSGCEKLGAFPEIRGKMDLLSEVLLSRSALWELPSSIGRLSGISLLDLHSCENLVTLPASISEMRKLRILNLKGCIKLETFPGNVQQLEELYAGNTAIQQLPDSIRNLSRLKVLSLRGGHKCQFAGSLILPSSFGDLQNLESLDLSGCNLSGGQVNALILLPSLLELNLSRNNFTSLPDGISRLCRLQYLNLTRCPKLKELPKLPSSILELYADDFLAKQSTAELPMYPRLNLVSFTSYRFDQPSYTENSNGSSVLDEIFSLFLSNNIDDVVVPSLNSNHRVSCSIVFPGLAIPTWFKHQSTEQTISFELANDWYHDNFEGFAICCVTLMGAGVCDPDSGLSGKYDYTFIKAKLICNDIVLEKECKVGTVSRAYGWCVCFTCIPLYASLQASGTGIKNLNQCGLFEASIHGRIVRQWGVHLIYKGNRQFYKSSLLKWNGIQSNFAAV